MLQSVAGPSPDEFTGSKVGTSPASTVRGFWEQTGMDRFPVQPAADLESCESLEALVRAILLAVTSCPPPTWRYGPRKSML